MKSKNANFICLKDAPKAYFVGFPMIERLRVPSPFLLFRAFRGLGKPDHGTRRIHGKKRKSGEIVLKFPRRYFNERETSLN